MTVNLPDKLSKEENDILCMPFMINDWPAVFSFDNYLNLPPHNGKVIFDFAVDLGDRAWSDAYYCDDEMTFEEYLELRSDMLIRFLDKAFGEYNDGTSS